MWEGQDTTVKDLHISSPCRRAKVAAAVVQQLFPVGREEASPLYPTGHSCVSPSGPPGAAQDLDMFSGFSSCHLDMQQQQ